MSYFVTKERVGHKEFEISCWITDTSTVQHFEVKELGHAKFNSLAAAIRAIKTKELNDRKGLKNPKAYLLTEGYGEEKKSSPVEVTSLRDKVTVWVRYLTPGKHSKRGAEGLNRLYADKEKLDQAIATETRLRKVIQEAYDAVPHWEPIPKD